MPAHFHANGTLDCRTKFLSFLMLGPEIPMSIRVAVAEIWPRYEDTVWNIQCYLYRPHPHFYLVANLDLSRKARAQYLRELDTIEEQICNITKLII